MGRVQTVFRPVQTSVLIKNIMDKYYYSGEFLKPYISDSEAETGAETVIYDEEGRRETEFCPSVSNDEEYLKVEPELEQIASELAELKRRLDLCLQLKRDKLRSKIMNLNEKIQIEQDAITSARNEDFNDLSNDHESPMVMTKPKSKPKKNKKLTKKSSKNVEPKKGEFRGNLKNAMKIKKIVSSEELNQIKILEQMKLREEKIEKQQLISGLMRKTLLPLYRSNKITKEAYKEVLKKCMSRAMLLKEIMPREIQDMVRNHVRKLQQHYPNDRENEEVSADQPI